jgi:hypothetical protein
MARNLHTGRFPPSRKWPAIAALAGHSPAADPQVKLPTLNHPRTCRDRARLSAPCSCQPVLWLRRHADDRCCGSATLALGLPPRRFKVLLPHVLLPRAVCRFSRSAHHAPKVTTHAAIAVANAGLTTHRSASAFGRNDSLTAVANHKESPKATPAATPVASHLAAARPTEPTSYFPTPGNPRSPGAHPPPRDRPACSRNTTVTADERAVNSQFVWLGVIPSRLERRSSDLGTRRPGPAFRQRRHQRARPLQRLTGPVCSPGPRPLAGQGPRVADGAAGG